MRKKFYKYEGGTAEVTTPIFFSHIGNTDVTKFCTCARDSYTSSYKKFRVNSTSFIHVWFGVMMNWKETPPCDCKV